MEYLEFRISSIVSNFRITKKSGSSRARTGVLHTNHGILRTPFFMPVATQGAVKHIASSEMRKLGAQILLSNTYHLMLRPGEKLIQDAGGLHDFMDWQKPVLTDSGGYQVFSLAGEKRKGQEKLVKLSNEGVWFRSHLDGSKHFLTPERVIGIQWELGVDIAVCLDECVSLPADAKYLAESIALTTKWAQAARDHHHWLKEKAGKKKKHPLLFAVVQGGLNRELRLRSLHEIMSLGFDGYNIGGLSVGETPEQMYEVLDYLVPQIPENKPRYLMGVGYPENMVKAVKYGVDMFDCVIPTREGRHGRLFQFKDPSPGFKDDRFYTTLNIVKSGFARDFAPINEQSAIAELRDMSKAYLHHLFRAKEPLAQRLATLNNLEFYLKLMKLLRQHIREGKL